MAQLAYEKREAYLGRSADRLAMERMVLAKQKRLINQAYELLRFGFTALPLIAGIDKYFQWLVNWDRYLAPAIANLFPFKAQTLMLMVGGMEIAAGCLVAFKPRIGGYVVCAWLIGIIINLMLIPGYYDIGLRDFGLALGALALSRLSASRAALTVMES